MDVRLKQLSYSSILTLHSCPRKYQLYKLNAQEELGSVDSESAQNVTFAFGHIVGEGIQAIFAGASLDETIFAMFRGWHADLEDRNIKQNKNFYLAVSAVQKVASMREQGFLQDWEVMEYNGKLACELAFRISLPDGFKLRGHVDAVLKNKVTNEIMVLECKTSSFTNLNPAMYKNSAQGIGYSVVLDVIAPEISSYQVLYLVYLTKDMSYEQYSFPKSYLQRALWIKELLLNIEIIKMYEIEGVYPMHGESCYSFYRECEYMNTCTLNTRFLSKPFDAEIHADKQIYDVELTLMDLVDAQMKKSEAALELQESRPTLAIESDTLL